MYYSPAQVGREGGGGGGGVREGRRKWKEWTEGRREGGWEGGREGVEGGREGVEGGRDEGGRREGGRERGREGREGGEEGGKGGKEGEACEKLWFGVSKFASTSSIVTAVEWEKASDLVKTSHETHTALGPVSMSDYTLSCRPNFPTGITRRNIGLWLSNGVNDLFCQSRKCYTPAEGCVCKLCNSPADHESHIIHCR